MLNNFKWLFNSRYMNPITFKYSSTASFIIKICQGQTRDISQNINNQANTSYYFIVNK